MQGAQTLVDPLYDIKTEPNDRVAALYYKYS